MQTTKIMQKESGLIWKTMALDLNHKYNNYTHNKVLVITGKAGPILSFVKAFVKLVLAGILVGFPCATAPPL